MWIKLYRVGLFLLGIVICLPVIAMLFGSIKSDRELSDALAAVLGSSDGAVEWYFLPLYPTLAHFRKLLFYTPEFFTVFWNTVFLCVCILAGQTLVAVPAAWGFARFSFWGRKSLFTLYVILMLTPFIVTMLPMYLVLNGMRLLDSHAAIILPGIFSSFPVFIIYRAFRAIPKELFEAAKIDGAGEWQILVRLGLPLGSPGILSSLVLGFLECWSMVEQPLAFLPTPAKWPLSLYLPEIDLSRAGTALAASVITLIPAVFVFFIGQDYLEQGIVSSGMKE